jgi:hypothetical protein
MRLRGRGGGGVCCELVAVFESVQLCELSLKGTESLAVRPRTAWFLFFLLASASSSFSFSGSLRPSSQVSRAARGLLRYGGLGRLHCGHPEGLVFICFSPLRREGRSWRIGAASAFRSLGFFVFFSVPS